MHSPIRERTPGRQTAYSQATGGSFPREGEGFGFPLERLRKLLGPTLRSVRADALKHSATPAAVYRLTLDYDRGASFQPPTLIAKRIAPEWDGDVQGYRREFEFYRQWADSLAFALPEVVYAGPEPDSDYGLVLLQDVAATHRFFATDHVWKRQELGRAMRAYAQLHVQGYSIMADCQTPEWLFPRYEERVRAQAAELPRKVANLVEAGVWGEERPFSGIERLVERVVADIQTFANLPVSLLHNDVAPQNIGLRVGRTAANGTAAPGAITPDVVLVDWEMVGWGLPEMDLAYIFMQPFGNTRHVDRAEMLNIYWQERQRLEGTLPPLEQRQAVQQYADALFALWLIPVAYERHRHPFPAGSAPRIYWDHMFAVLEERLRGLAAV